jgi:hypothetical protein
VVRAGLRDDTGAGCVPALRRGEERLRRRLDGAALGYRGRAASPRRQPWPGWLDSLGIENSGVVDTADPVPYSVVVFRDPDNIQLELIYMAG